MTWVRNIGLTRSYPLLLLGAVLFGSSPQVWIAVTLLIIHGLAIYRPPLPPQGLALTLATLLLAPILLAPLAGSIPAVLLVLLGLPLLEQELRRLAPNLYRQPFREGRQSSSLLNAVTLSLIATGLLGFALGNLALLSISGIALAGVLGRLAQAMLSTRKTQIRFETGRVRVRAGDEVRSSLRLENRSGIFIRIAFSSQYPWLELSPEEHVLSPGGHIMLELTASPPLAGPTHPVIQVMVLDPWGLIWTGMSFTPLEMHVIPRARYAAWLARRYLEQTGSQREIAESVAPVRVRGVEFNALREYQPGDRIRDIDWRHTAKFREVVIKEHVDPPAGAALLLINLVVAAEEEADWLAYHMVSTALTAAQQSIPTALALYNHQEVSLATGFQHPREALKQALRFSQWLIYLKRRERLLAPPDPLNLRRSARFLESEDLDGGVKLARIIRIELGALREMAEEHPLTKALQRSLGKSRQPATITVISRWNHDAEALAVMLPRLREQRYAVVDLLTQKR